MTTEQFHPLIPTQLATWRFILLVPRTKIPTAEMDGWSDNGKKKHSPLIMLR
jgi:hypothetical protein